MPGASFKSPASKILRKLPRRKHCGSATIEIRESLESAQLRIQRERGTDRTFFSPRASGMAHHIGDADVSLRWSEICNELIHRVCTLYPDNFVGVCQLPQSPGRRRRQTASPSSSVASRSSASSAAISIPIHPAATGSIRR